MLSAGAWPLRPNVRFSLTVSQGNTDPCCEMRMPLEFGRARGAPSIITEPESGAMNPAIMLSRVVLPQPEGPTIATNSPSRTVRLTFSTTRRGPLSEAKDFFRSRTSILVRIAPPDPLEPLQQPHDAVERQADYTDDDHPGNHQVVAIPGVARVHDHVPQAGAQRDHFSRHDDQPGDSEADAHA